MYLRQIVGFFFFSTLLLAGPITPARYEIPKKMFLDGGGVVRLTSGEEVRMDTTAELLPVFEDLMPGANWAHPARVLLLDKTGNIVKEKKVQFPPVDLEIYQLLSGPEVRKEEGVPFNLQTFKGAMKVSRPDEHYALLINGQADRRHWNDFSFLYRVLTQVYGYDQKNIFVADGKFKTTDNDLDGDGDTDIQYDSDLASMHALMEQMKTTLPANAHFLIAVNDHGVSVGNESAIVLKDGNLMASEFQKWLGSVKVNSILSIFEQCYSGGFVRPSVGQNRVAMSAATNNEYSWASMDLKFDEFIYHAISAFAKQKHDGTPVNADLDKDGFISAREAYTYAVGTDARNESPVLESHQNSGQAFGLGVAKRK